MDNYRLISLTLYPGKITENVVGLSELIHFNQVAAVKQKHKQGINFQITEKDGKGYLQMCLTWEYC